MAKYGPDTIFFYGKDWDVLKKMINESDGVAGPCHAFEKLIPLFISVRNTSVTCKQRYEQRAPV